MAITHSLDDMKHYHNEAMQFFASQLMLSKEAMPKIIDELLAKAAVLLISSGQTGAALLRLSILTEVFTGEAVMLARAFMEKVTNFCYVGVCSEEEFPAFILHPVYKHFHNVGKPKLEDDLNLLFENQNARKEKQEKLKHLRIVQDALAKFSETKTNLNWIKKTLGQRIDAITEWGKLLDVFFTINKIQYYSDASETLHGSLYGCTYNLSTFEPEFDLNKEDELPKKLIRIVLVSCCI